MRRHKVISIEMKWPRSAGCGNISPVRPSPEWKPLVGCGCAAPMAESVLLSLSATRYANVGPWRFPHASGRRHTPRSTKAFPPISQNSRAFAAHTVPSKILLKLGFITTKELASTYSQSLLSIQIFFKFAEFYIRSGKKQHAFTKK